MTTVVVTAAVIERDDALLVTRRQLREELDVEARVTDEVFTTTHAYPERVVELHFFRCELLGEPRPQQGQEMRWVRRDELHALEFPPADEELIQVLRS